ncbi:MAG TPA: ParB/RepB/Spo0J family partition protein [Ignavibacteria bacterium]|nr:ParB/RepB/Spo0J family partition protein [Ignavibacteria bacterium]HRJ98812.1 ParB/RepB/Spo0J family partition protein [Ignavibacteria bacterium]
MENKPQALGKGLSAIFDEKKIDISFTEENSKKNSAEISVSMIQTNPFQPREDFDEEKLNELAESIRLKGIIQPVTVRKTENGFKLVSGERRLRAAKMLGLQKIPVYFYEAGDETDENMLELALIENLQREDLNPMELSDSYQKLMESYNLTQEKIAEKVSKNRSTVANFLRLQRLPVEIKISLRKNEITEAHARMLLRIDNEDDQITLWKRIVNENITVKNLQEITKDSVKKPRTKKMKLGEIYDPYIQSIEDDLRNFFGTKVSVKRKSKYSGEIIIEYFSNEDLERIMDKCGK